MFQYSPARGTKVQRADSKRPGTMLKIDDDGDLSNGTPNYEIICPIFANRNIISTTYTCAESVAGQAFPDCDGNGLLTIFDFVCYSELFQDEDPSADINSDGVVNHLDFVQFRSLYFGQ